MRLALDTNAYCAAAKGEPRAVGILKGADSIHLPFIALGELRAGFAYGSIGHKNESQLTQFLNSPRVDILYADEQTTQHYARIFAQLKRSGAPIPTNDLWIAALVVQHDLILLSSDNHFSKLPQIVRVHP